MKVFDWIKKLFAKKLTFLSWHEAPENTSTGDIGSTFYFQSKEVTVNDIDNDDLNGIREQITAITLGYTDH